MQYTIFGRLREVLKTSSGRRHLLNTWRFSLSEAFRAASGQQVDEILVELQEFETLHVKNHIDVGLNLLIEESKFNAIASEFKAGKTAGHSGIYSYLNLQRTQVRNVLEIGIGTNDPSAPSSMGSNGSPGASLKMWTEIFPKAKVIGADVDRKSFISGDRYDSTFVDTTNLNSLQTLRSELEKRTGGSQKFDLIIDDGLHTPESNLRTLRALLPLVRPLGYYVIEDIHPSWTGFWKTVGASLESKGFEVHFIEAMELGTGSSTFMSIKQRANS